MKTNLLKPTFSLGRTEEEHYRRIASLTPNSRRILSHLKIVPINKKLSNDESLLISSPIKEKLFKKVESALRPEIVKYPTDSCDASLEYKPDLVTKKVNNLLAAQQRRLCRQGQEISIKHSTALNMIDVSSNQTFERTRSRLGYNSKHSFKDSPVSYIRHSNTPTCMSINSICQREDLKLNFKQSPYAIDPVFTTNIDSIYGKAIVSKKHQPKVIKSPPVSFDADHFDDPTFGSFHSKPSLPFISIPNISTDLTIESIRDTNSVYNLSEIGKPLPISYVLKQNKSANLTLRNFQTEITKKTNYSTTDNIDEMSKSKNQFVRTFPSPLKLNLKLSKYLTTNSASTSNNASFNLNDLSIESIAHPNNGSSHYTSIPSLLAINDNQSKHIRKSAPAGRSTPIGFMTDLSIESIHNKSSPARNPKQVIRQYKRRVPTKPLANRALTSVKVSTSTPNKSPRSKSVWTVTPTKDVGMEQQRLKTATNLTPIRPKLLGRINRPWIQTPPRIVSPKMKSSQSLQVG